MSLFGTGSAKFEVSGSTVTLDYSNLRPNWVESNISIRRSIYDHYITFDNVGSYSDFWIDINLWEYTIPEQKFAEIYPTYLYAKVYFWPHSDGFAISGSDNKPTVFFIKDMAHRYIDPTITNKDILSLHFVSTDFCHLTGSLGVQTNLPAWGS